LDNLDNFFDFANSSICAQIAPFLYSFSYSLSGDFNLKRGRFKRKWRNGANVVYMFYMFNLLLLFKEIK
jgi:hypothetical protein